MKNENLLIDLVNILSFAIGIQNLDLNDKQIKQIEDHLVKQDKQYEEIIELLNSMKGGNYDRES